MVFSFTESNISLVLVANEVSFCNAEGLIIVTEGFIGLGEKATCVVVSVTFASTAVFALVSDPEAIGNLVGASADSVGLTPMSVCVELGSLRLGRVFRYYIWRVDLVRFVFR